MNALARQFPNILTGIRVLLAPLTGYLILRDYYLSALLVFGFAGASDALDGFLARRFGLVSRFGEYLDPAADKLLMLASFVTLTIIGRTPLWLTVIVLARDAAIVLGVLIANLFSLPLKMEPLAIGKACTAVQIGYIAAVLLLLVFAVDMPAVSMTAAYVCAGVTILSWLAYGNLLLKAFAVGRRPA